MRLPQSDIQQSTSPVLAAQFCADGSSQDGAHLSRSAAAACAEGALAPSTFSSASNASACRSCASRASLRSTMSLQAPGHSAHHTL